MYLCKFCGKECKNAKSISIHLIQAHNIKPQTYYDKFFKKINEDVCNNESCSKLTTFYNIRLGYANYCSLICANTSKTRKLQEKQRMSKKYKNKHERIKTGKLVKKAFEDSNKRKHISDGIKRAYKNNPELRKNASEHSKKLWNNEKIRKVMVKNMREKCRTENHRENQRKIALQISKDPE